MTVCEVSETGGADQVTTALWASSQEPRRGRLLLAEDNLINQRVAIAMLSGVTTPIEAMPQWMQPLTNVNPVRHFAVISRGVLLKDIGLDVLYPNLLALSIAAAVLVGLSVWRFRKQLG